MCQIHYLLFLSTVFQKKRAGHRAQVIWPVLSVIYEGGLKNRERQRDSGLLPYYLEFFLFLLYYWNLENKPNLTIRWSRQGQLARFILKV